jgi:hypothetical protein
MKATPSPFAVLSTGQKGYCTNVHFLLDCPSPHRRTLFDNPVSVP